MRRLRILGNILMVLGILVVFSSTLLPLVKLPQTITKKGPTSLTSSDQYWIDTFILPTIDNGTTVTVYLVGDHLGGLGITMIPYREGVAVIGAAPIINYIFETDQQTLVGRANASLTSEYF